MKLLYTDILPLKTPAEKTNIYDFFSDSISRADKVEIAVGYVSRNSLIELGKLVDKYHIHSISLVVGMYYYDGMPEEIYNALCDLEEQWGRSDIGKIYIIRSFSYHGKAYAFFRNGLPLSGIIGSNNLSSIKPEANNLRQYEFSVGFNEPNVIEEISGHIHNLMEPRCSLPIEKICDINLIRQQNTALNDQEFVEKITPEDVNAYKAHCTEVSFDIPLKVPANKQDPHLRGSNINVCYAYSKSRPRVWYECEIIVPKLIRNLPGYPEYEKPFMAVTDDGWKFQVLTCGQNNKNLYSKDDLKIMGKWLKGRLTASGLIEPVSGVSNRPESDPDLKGLITEDILHRYGRDYITLTKTDLKTTLDNGTVLDVWMLSFLPN